MKEEIKMNNDELVEYLLKNANECFGEDRRVTALLKDDAVREIYERLPDVHKIELLKGLWEMSKCPMLQLNEIGYDALSKIGTAIDDDNTDYDECGYIHRVYVTDKELTTMFEGASSTFDSKLGGSWYREEKHAWDHLSMMSHFQLDPVTPLNVYVLSVDAGDVDIVWTSDDEQDGILVIEHPTVTVKNPDRDLVVCHKYVGTINPELLNVTLGKAA